MKNLLLIFAGIIMMVLVSATTVSVMTVKPATPKNVYVSYYSDDYLNCTKTIRQLSKEGYIVKKLERVGGQMGGHYILIMEKY